MQADWTTTYTRDALGQLTSAEIADGRARTVTFTNDENGQILRRSETGIIGQTGSPHELWYRFGGNYHR